MTANLFNQKDFEQCMNVLEQRVYTSRLLGKDKRLVMHGGGNTSVKTTWTNLLGKKEQVLYIKGSGWDLATIENEGFAGVRLTPLLDYRKLNKITDTKMVNLLRTHLIDYQMPTPSIETLVHAFIPETFVDHTHADAILTLTNQPNAEEIIQGVYEDKVAIVPYIMPGFELSKACADIYKQYPEIEGLILLKHGIFTFGKTAKESYKRMIQLVDRADTYIEKTKKKKNKGSNKVDDIQKLDPAGSLSTIYKVLAEEGFGRVLHLDRSKTVETFLKHPDAKALSQIGPLTPDHIIRTKQFPLFLQVHSDHVCESHLKQALQHYMKDYQAYFERHALISDQKQTMLDPIPHIMLIPGLGMVTVGKTKKEAEIVAELCLHTINVILDAELVGSYTALDEHALFDIEYWELEQAKLKKQKQDSVFVGKTVVVTGGSRGIGAAICKQYAQAGAEVFNLDIMPSEDPSVTTIETDVSKLHVVLEAFDQVLLETGKVDIAVMNAGIFPPSCAIDDLDLLTWRKSTAVNLDGAFYTTQAAMKLLKRNPRGGDIVFIASKNVPAPGKKVAAYSVMKAAVTQLARVCALEGAEHGIRVNMLHPNMIFDTGIWSDEVIQERAQAYDMTPEAYRTHNLLKTELNSGDVAKAVLALTDGSFSKTTGAQIPVDGGNERVI